MTVGLPGAGIGGLFYLASTLLVPLRSLVRRLRGRPDVVTWRGQMHVVLLALGILVSLWLAGWFLAFVVPERLVTTSDVASTTSRTVIPLATFGIGVGTLVIVLVAVEIAHYACAPKDATRRKHAARRPR